MTNKLLSILLLTAGLTFYSCKHKPYEIPVSQRVGDPTICFDRDILPIFITQCAKSGCHDAGKHKEGYILDSYENIVKKGIAPGNAIGSVIYQSILGYTEEAMPQDAPRLSDAQIEIIKRWINAGAIKDNNCSDDCDSNNYTFSANIQPLLNKYCTGCHSGTSPQGSLTLASYTNIKDAVQNRNLIKCINYETGYSGMPKGGLHLSACQITQVEKWVAAGMPNN